MPRQFQDTLLQITARASQQQEVELRQWRAQWTQCGYPKDSTYVDATLQLGRLFLKSGPYQEAARLSEEVVALYGQFDPKLRRSDLAKAYYRQALALYSLEAEDKGIELLRKVIRTADNTAAGKLWASLAYLHMTYTYFVKGDYQKALILAERGEMLAREIRDTYSISQLLQQKAQILSELKRFEEAKNALQDAIDLLGNDPVYQPSVASHYRVLGDVYKNLNKTDEAINSLNKAFQIARRQNYKPSDFATSLGFYYYELGNYPQAIQYYRTALALHPSANSKSLILDNLGAAYWKLKQFRRALSFYQLGIAEHVAGFEPATLGQLPSAQHIRQTTQKLYLLTTIQDKADTWLDYARQAPDLRKKQVRLRNALRTYALADSMIDYMRYEHEGESSKLFWRQQTHGLYERAIEACYLANDPEHAFHFMEKSKAVLLADKLNELGANRQLSESDTRRQRALRDSVTDLQYQLNETPIGDKNYPILRTRLEKTEDEFETFRRKLEKTNPAYYRYKYDSHIPSLAKIREKLFAGAAGPAEASSLVSYFIGDRAVYAFVLTSRRPRLVKLAITPAQYQSYAGKFLTLSANRPYLNAHYLRYQELAHFLYRQLWQPLEVDTRRVVVVPDGIFLPFEALLTSTGPDDFLLKRHAISYAYSARLLEKMPDRPAASLGSGFVGFAPEFFKTHKLPPLSGSSGALASVSQSFWFGKKLVNTEATKANFLRYAPAAHVIQLFTHADADSTDLTEPRIYFHDAALNLSELNRSERFQAQLLVLSACRTGVGAHQRGEGVFSLARSFAALGVPSTLTTLWTVDNQPTYALTELFYAHLNEGLPMDIALQRAKLDLIGEGSSANGLPSQWAGMILVGEVKALPDGRWYRRGGFLLLGILLLSGIFWWNRKRAT